MPRAGRRAGHLPRRQAAGLGLAVAAVGYFLWYMPYSGLAKALSSGELPGWDEPVAGFTILPAAGIGTFAGALTVLAVSGWWRYLPRRRVLGRRLPAPDLAGAPAGAFTAVIIATTTLNYTFVGVSLLLMLTLMRAGVLLLSPLTDLATRRSVQVTSWAALALSLLAIATTLTGAGSYRMPLAALLSLGMYVAGYAGRFTVMHAQAKQGRPDQDRRYLVNEMLWAVIIQLGVLAALALAGPGQVAQDLRHGFTGFLTTTAAIPALSIGLLYAALYIFGTIIYLDRREYSYCVPLNRCASVLSVVVASYALTALLGLPVPTPRQLVAAGIVIVALLVLTMRSTRGKSGHQPATSRAAGRAHAPGPAARFPWTARPGRVPSSMGTAHVRYRLRHRSYP